MHTVTPSPLELKKLINETNKLLKLYHKKEQWPSIYPSLNQLANKFIYLYSTNPHALHAHLNFYAKSFGYTTNLVINQLILIIAICEGNNYLKSFTKELVIAGIADQLCTSFYSDKLAANKTLKPQEKKIMDHRHLLSLKVLNIPNIENKQIQRILSRLDVYHKNIAGNKSVALYDNTTTIVAIALTIARHITPRIIGRQLTVLQSIKRLYLICSNEFAQDCLITLTAQIKAYPVATSLKYNNEHALLINTKDNKNLIAILNKDDSLRFIKTNKKIIPNFKPVFTLNENLLFDIWFTKDYVINVPVCDKQKISKSLNALGAKEFFEFKAIEKCIADFSYIETRLRQAAADYNRQNLYGSSIRHCLTMIGLNTAGLLCQRVLLETLIKNNKHPFIKDIWNKYTYIQKVIKTLIKTSSGGEFEKLLCPFTAAVIFILNDHSSAIMRLVTPPTSRTCDNTVSIRQLFGFDRLDNKELNKFFDINFKYSDSHSSFLMSEESNKHDEQSHLFCLITYLTIQLHSGIETNSISQQGFIDEILKSYDWGSLDEFKMAFIDLSPFCSIE
jgi:hypothetical protein